MGKLISLEELQSIYYDRFSELHNFLTQHGIKYFAIGGTLLGAVRHKGFIPWDDDMDLGMTRDEYNKFISVCSQLDKNYFKVINHHNEKHVEHAITKICLLGVKNLNSRFNNKVDSCFHIDIFPIDNPPLNQKELKGVVNKIKSLNALMYYKYRNIKKTPILKKIPLVVVKMLLLPFNGAKFAKKVDKLITSTKIDRNYNELWVSSGVYGYKKECHDASIFQDSIYLDFGTCKISCPSNYKKLLLETYGSNYMTPIKTGNVEFKGMLEND